VCVRAGEAYLCSCNVGKEELATRLNIVRLIAEYLDAVIWFHAAGLLPEHSGQNS